MLKIVQVVNSVHREISMSQTENLQTELNNFQQTFHNNGYKNRDIQETILCRLNGTASSKIGINGIIRKHKVKTHSSHIFSFTAFEHAKVMKFLNLQ